MGAHDGVAAQVLAPCAKGINVNDAVMRLYLEQLLPGIAAPGDDGNYGSAACYDVLCLQVTASTALRRVLTAQVIVNASGSSAYEGRIVLR